MITTDLSDDEIANWASGRPANPTTEQGVRMAMEIQRRRAVDLPKIDFVSRGQQLCFAELAGASLTIGYVSEDSANLVMVDEQGHVLVDIEVRRLGDADIRSSAQEIGAALLWSRWRCVTPISSAAAAGTPPPPAPR